MNYFPEPKTSFYINYYTLLSCQNALFVQQLQTNLCTWCLSYLFDHVCKCPFVSTSNPIHTFLQVTSIGHMIEWESPTMVSPETNDCNAPRLLSWKESAVIVKTQALIFLPLALFIILDRPLLGAEALASRLFLFSFILSLMSSRLCWKDFFRARSFAMTRDLRLCQSLVCSSSAQRRSRAINPSKTNEKLKCELTFTNCRLAL